MSVETILTKTMKDVPKAIAAGVVDMSTGMLLGVKTIDSHPQEVLDLVAAATKDMFEGDNVTTIENTFKRARGVTTSERYFREIVVTSTNLLHVFARLKSMQSVVVVVVCREDTNLGLALMKMRAVCGSETI
jgi:predicted regulator of Ras-like GTPase activity (Roadblock/LC7/MglB family)